jgi:hypothetical protein
MKLNFTFDPKFFEQLPTEGLCGQGCNPGNWGFGNFPNEDFRKRRYYRTGSGHGKYVFFAQGMGYFEGRRNSFWAGSSGVTIDIVNKKATIVRAYNDEVYTQFEMPITITEVYTSTPDDIIVEGVPHFLY